MQRGIETIQAVHKAFPRMHEAFPLGKLTIPGMNEPRKQGNVPAKVRREAEKKGRGRSYAPKQAGDGVRPEYDQTLLP